jgi:hypothetical protein
MITNWALESQVTMKPIDNMVKAFRKYALGVATSCLANSIMVNYPSR